MMLALIPCRCMTIKAVRMAMGGDDHHQGRAQVEQEGEADQHHHRELLHQLAGEVVDGALDKIGSIVDGDDLHPPAGCF